MQTLNHWVAQVFEALPTLGAFDQENFEKGTRELLSQGWTVEEVVSLWQLTRKVNPSLSDEEALPQMDAIRNEVRIRLKDPLALEKEVCNTIESLVHTLKAIQYDVAVKKNTRAAFTRGAIASVLMEQVMRGILTLRE